MDMKKFNKFMMEFAPMLMQMKMRERGYEAWGKTQRQTIYESLMADLEKYAAQEAQAGRERNAAFALKYADHLVNAIAKGVEGMDRPGLVMPQRVKEAGIPGAFPEITMPEPTVPHEEAIEPYQVLMEDIEKLYGGISPEEKEVIARGVPLKGSKFMKKIIEDVAKARKEEAVRKQREREITGAEKGRELGWAEWQTRKEELEVEKGKAKGEVADKKKLTDLIKKRDSYRDKAANVSYMRKRKEYEASAEKATKQIEALQKEMGLKSDKEYQEYANYLNSIECTLSKINEIPGLKEDIEKNGFEVWVLAGYLSE